MGNCQNYCIKDNTLKAGFKKSTLEFPLTTSIVNSNPYETLDLEFPALFKDRISLSITDQRVIQRIINDQIVQKKFDVTKREISQNSYNEEPLFSVNKEDIAPKYILLSSTESLNSYRKLNIIETFNVTDNDKNYLEEKIIEKAYNSFEQKNQDSPESLQELKKYNSEAGTPDIHKSSFKRSKTMKNNESSKKVKFKLGLKSRKEKTLNFQF